MSFDYFLLCSLISNNIGVIFCTILAFLMWFLNIFLFFSSKCARIMDFLLTLSPKI